jgi:caa(3)-type oxidase subunit IV
MISAPTLIVVGLVLLALTLATLLLARQDLGIWSTPVALGIAGTKGLLILLFFMHGRFASPVVRIVMCAALLWLGILMVGTADDYLTRHWLTIPGK